MISPTEIKDCLLCLQYLEVCQQLKKYKIYSWKTFKEWRSLCKSKNKLGKQINNLRSCKYEKIINFMCSN
jgi:hypothetical protein